MPYADNQGVRIHYRIEGAGPPLVLQHGFTRSLEDWESCGYVARLQSDYQIILIDARGHGQSDKPHDPVAYPLEKRVGDVVAVLNDLGVAKAHYWGYSMGGWLGFGMAKHAADRVRTLVIGGQHAYARDQSATRRLVRRGLENGRETFIAGLEERFGFTASPEDLAYYLAADLDAYLAMSIDRPSLEDVLPTIQMPCCLYVGESDDIYEDAKSTADRIAGVHFFSFAGLTHADAFERSDLVLPRVVSFLRGQI
jgi:pimeloyl-ACP methyl ester carboxylesterase